MQLNSRISGIEDGTPVVLLHGLFGARENLGMLARQLATSHRVHSLDLRNHGRSPHSEQIDYPLMAADVLSYLDQHELEQVDLVGHSMGGKVAMQLALNQPQRIRRLAVLDIAPIAYSHRHQAVVDALLAVHNNRIDGRAQADTLLSQYLPEAGVRQFLLQNLVRGDDGWVWRFNLPALISHYDEITAAVDGPAPFTGPTLFLKGDRSDYLLPEHKPEILARFPQARMRQFAGCGHWLHAEAPERVGPVIQKFLTR